MVKISPVSDQEVRSVYPGAVGHRVDVHKKLRKTMTAAIDRWCQESPSLPRKLVEYSIQAVPVAVSSGPLPNDHGSAYLRLAIVLPDAGDEGVEFYAFKVWEISRG